MIMQGREYLFYKNSDNEKKKPELNLSSLEDKEWREFKINDILKVSGTITTHPSNLIKGGKTPRITCAATNNGLDDVYENEPTEKGGVLTVDSATVGFVSYQEVDFIATDHVEKLSMKNGQPINRYVGLFLVRAITSATADKYGYGYKFSQSRIKKQTIILPINSNNEPDYLYMENYMKTLEYEKLKRYLDYKKLSAKQ